MNLSSPIPFLDWFNLTLNPGFKYIWKQNYDKLIIIGVVTYEILFILRVVHDKKGHQTPTVSNRFFKDDALNQSK